MVYYKATKNVVFGILPYKITFQKTIIPKLTTTYMVEIKLSMFKNNQNHTLQANKTGSEVSLRCNKTLVHVKLPSIFVILKLLRFFHKFQDNLSLTFH